MSKKYGFENGNVVPIVSGNVQSHWVQMPNEQRKRDERIHHTLVTGQSSSMWKTYLENVQKEKRAKVHHALDVEIAKRRARLQARLDNA
jgi:hypothetical protein|tara:strand:- start:122 stop:388 length:267 start_codon:yes stop_codon:yes gene_type:complete